MGLTEILELSVDLWLLRSAPERVLTQAGKRQEAEGGVAWQSVASSRRRDFKVLDSTD